MKWLWFIGPLTVLFVAVLGALFPSREERRIQKELRRWLDDMLGPLKVGKKTKTRRVRRVPPQFNRLLQEAGSGARVADIVLLPGTAYIAVRVADALSSANQITVLCRLAHPTPRMVCRPIPIVDGRAIENKGIVFSDDADFSDTFLVEGDNPKAIRKWLDEPIREALMELPDAWLRCDGKSLALTLYGYANADTLDELVAVADGIFAEKGASPESLFGDLPPLQKSAGYRREPEEIARPRPERKTKPRKKRAEPEVAPASARTRILAGAIDFGLYALGVIATAAMVGAFDRFHPAIFFSSPDLAITEAWQGGWTTKGFGAFVIAETLLCLVFVYQGYLASTRGSSIGKRLLGARVVRSDGQPMDFWRGVFLRSYVFGLVPLLAAAFLAKRSGQLSPRRFFEAIPQMQTLAAGAIVLAILAIALLSSKDGRGLHDRLSGTRVVAAERFTLSAVQLGIDGPDRIVMRRLGYGIGAMLLFILVNVVAFNLDGVGFWIY